MQDHPLSNKSGGEIVNQSLSEPIASPANIVSVAVDDIKAAISAVVNTVGQRPASSKGVSYERPFMVDDDLMKKLNTRVETIMSELIPFPGGRLRFHAKAVMPNNSKQTFDNFDRFLERAADRHDPAGMELTWEQRLSVPFSAMATITVNFDTGSRINDGGSGAFDTRAAFIDLNVSGASDEWVKRTFEKIEPVVNNTILRGIYSPFFLLRNVWVMGFSW